MTVKEAGAPAMTVMVPEFVPVKEPLVAWMTPLPTRWPVITALFLSIEAVKSPLTTPPEMLVNVQLSAAILLTKLSYLVSADAVNRQAAARG